MRRTILMRILVVVGTAGLAGSATLAMAAQPVYDTIIRNGRIIDGTGAAWFRGDIAIKDGRIAEVGNVDIKATATRIIKADDHYVAPGFIDVHTHCEGDFDDHPEAENFIRMGVTTVVTGNCGGSYTNLAESLPKIASHHPGVNVATFIGHNSVRRKVMGNVDRDPSTTEILAMRQVVAQAMQDGAIGLSTGLIYTPGTYSKTPEIVALAEEAGKAGGIYVTHMRSEGAGVFKAIKEALTVGREAKLPVHISHFKISSVKHHGESTVTLGMVEQARRNGQDVTVDQYAYTASSTTIRAMLDSEFVVGSSDEIQARMTDPTTRALVIKDIIDSYKAAGRENLDYATVASFRADPSINGKSIYEIAKLWKGDQSWQSQAEVICDIVSSGSASMIFHSMDENDVQNIMRYPNTMVASDSGVRVLGQGKPHPRGYGNNARVLGLYTRDLKVLRLEDAVRKMTSLPARTMRFMDRGILRPGMAADVVVFDLAKVADPATFQQPHAYAEGFEDVLVNGQAIILNGQMTAERGGEILYGPGKVDG